jgi:hypothetical protein
MVQTPSERAWEKSNVEAAGGGEPLGPSCGKPSWGHGGMGLPRLASPSESEIDRTR